MYKIIYQNSEGSLCIIEPISNLDIKYIAKKDVPWGIPYKIISCDNLPKDRTFRNAWRIKFDSCDGIGEGQNDNN